MSNEPTPAPAPPSSPTTTVPPTTATDTERQLAELAEAVRSLSRSHAALVDALDRPRVRPAAARVVVSGDPGDGVGPAAVVDYARLSPVQQIALGLRTAKPPVPRPAPDPDVSAAGAD